MKIMADLEAVNLGMDENEADIAEELQDFDESFDTRSEASNSDAAESSGSEPSISSVSTAPSSINLEQQRKHKSKVKNTKVNEKHKKSTAGTKRPSQNGKSGSGGSSKKKRSNDRSGKEGRGSSTNKTASTTTNATTVAPSMTKSSSKSSEGTKKSSSDNATAKKSRKKASSGGGSATDINSSNGSNKVGSEAIVSSNGESSGKDTLSNIAKGTSFTAKSDESEAEERVAAVPPPPNFESDSESVDSDAAANVKRNGRKATLKSVSPEKKMSSSGLSGGSGGGSATKSKSYDYMTKLNYLFRDTRFFLIKSNNGDNIALSKSKNVWATLPQNDANLNQAFKEARNVLLIFSVNESGKFAGFARMSAPSSKDIPQVAWVLPPSISPKALGGVIQLDWICRKELSFNCTSHLYNSWNEGKPVKIGRDGQEIEPKVGAELCRLFPEDEKIELTPILRKSKETAKMMRERGIRVVYKQPRSLSSRGSRGGGSNGGYRNGGSSSSGPIRHKRIYSSAPHRPYKIPTMGPPSSGFKRGASPYRISNGCPTIGSSRSGGGDSLLPPWERYINSAAAEAYVADYMRTMHGQLPPLPFVPFGQLPLPPSGSGGAGMPPTGASYEQLPPPVRYYDGPPLPDYPPPQAIRPPPPGFDKPPSYEDFAVWKNAGLPTVPPPGFPGLSTSNGSGSGTAGNSAGNFAQHGGGGSSGGSAGGGNGGHSSYRNIRETNSNMNRSRERVGGPGGRDYRGGGGDRERHFRGGGGSSGGHRTYRDSRR